MHASMAGGWQWLITAPAAAKRALLAASLGWMLDSMDVMLFSLVLPELQRELHLRASTTGLLMSLTLVSAAVGGIGFGWLADKLGRTRALTASMLIYSVCTALCGLVHTAEQLALCRILLGLGMGGEWAAGAALVAETWPGRDRGKALAVVQSSWAVGYALAAALAGLIMPHFGWRPVFFLGILPALVTLWVRRAVQEPELWQRKKAQRPEILDLLRPPLRRATMITASMNAATLFAWWGLFTWIPRFLSLPLAQGGGGLSIVQRSSWTVVMQVGAFLGYISFGYLADSFGRKRTYIAFLLVAALAVPFYAHAGSARMLLVLGPIIGFFGTGYFSGFSVIASELFPTAVRATSMGLVYNSGRLASAAAPFLIGYISERSSMSAALTTISFAFLIAALIATAVRETCNQQLE